jgi:hypothetical protein
LCRCELTAGQVLEPGAATVPAIMPVAHESAVRRPDVERARRPSFAFHLTTPQTLRELQTEEEAKLAEAQVRVLQQQVTAIQEFDTADFADLARLALAIGDGGVAATSAAAATNGAAPVPVDEVAPA